MPYKHGHRRANRTTATWISWRAMMERCHTPGAADYPRYGGRGIQVCPAWRSSFDTFVHDMGERPMAHTLDRRDVNGNYEPLNCRWATTAQQASNRRTNVLVTHDGRTQTVSEWARETGIEKSTLRLRLMNGWPVGKALTEPPMPRAERGLLGLKSRGVIGDLFDHPTKWRPRVVEIAARL